MEYNAQIQLNDGTYAEENVELIPQWFENAGNMYNPGLSHASLCFSCSAFSSSESMIDWGCTKNCGRDDDIINLLNAFEFKDIYTSGYNDSLNDSSSKAAYVFSTKKFETFTLVSVIIRGGNYGCEWVDNFNVSGNDKNIHNGFYISAQNIAAGLKNYTNVYHSKLKIWITGYSRGGAISNLLSAILKDCREYTNCDIFTYTFASPRVSNENVNYLKSPKFDYIFNIINPFDPVPMIPPEQWKYYRYGVDCILPYDTAMLEYVFEKMYKFSGAGISFSDTDSVAAVLHIMLIFASSSSEFGHNFQKPIMDFVKIYCEKETDSDGIWNRGDGIRSLIKLHGEKAREALKKSVLYKYSDYIGKYGIHIPDEIIVLNALFRIYGFENSENIFKNFISNGRINEIFKILKKGLSFEAFNQHRPELYLCWLNCADPADITFNKK